MKIKIKKSKMFVFCFLILFFLLFFSDLSAQTQWTKYAANPVITKGPASWDIIAIGQPTVLFENDTIKMWYAGVGADMKARICYAISTDGINWIKHSNPVLDVGGLGEWDRGWLDTPEIVRDNTGYKLYYYGDTVQQFAAINSAIGLASSSDGINWTKNPNNPVFTKGNTTDWDGSWVESPAVIYDISSGMYRMWFNGVDTNTWKVLIGVATSFDGVNWIKHTGNPVLSASTWGGYDDMWLGTPAVLHDNNGYEMWYASTSSNSYNLNTQAFDTVNICYATSLDGYSWIKYFSNPLFNTFTLPYDSLLDTGGPWAPDVIYDAGTCTYKMWFETYNGFMFATAPKVNTFDAYRYNLDNLSIYPNPFSFSTTIKAKNLDNATIEVYDNLARLVWQRNVKNENEIEFFKEDLKSGLYYIHIINNNSLLFGKMIIE